MVFRSRKLESIVCAVTLAEFAVMGNAIAPGRQSPSAWLASLSMAAGVGGLAGLLAFCFRRRPFAAVALILPGPLWFHRDIAAAYGRRALIAPWLDDFFGGLMALVCAAGAAWASFRLLRGTPIRKVPHALLAMGLGIAVGAAVTRGGTTFASEPLPSVGPWVVGGMFVPALVFSRYGQPLAALTACAAGLATALFPERYEELRLAAAWVLAGATALCTRGAWNDADLRPPSSWLAATFTTLILVAHLTVTSMDPISMAGLPRRGLGRTLLRAGQRGTDVDGDGCGNAFGQTDCAPWDPRVHSGRAERPGNSLDENCLAGPAPRALDWTHQREAINRLPHPYRGDIVLVVIDTLRYDAALDPGLALLRDAERRGTWFERAYSSSSFTSEVLVGLLASKLVTSVPMKFRSKLSGVPRAPVGGLSRWLRQAGYDTGFAGGATKEEGSYFLKTTFLDGIRVKRNLSMDAKPDQLTSAALQAYRALDPSKPRFLYVHSMWVHRPQADLKAHMRAAREVDAGLVHLRDQIGDGPLWIITADHGDEFHEHGGRDHSRTLFDEVMHVPLALMGGPVAQQRVKAVTATRSVFPTLAAMTAPERAPKGLGPYLCLTSGAPCGDMPVPMALEVPGVHLHGLLLGHTKVVRDLVVERALAYDLRSDPHELNPFLPSQAQLDHLTAWEEQMFGVDDGSQTWPYVLVH